jgi:hypothetical protein
MKSALTRSVQLGGMLLLLSAGVGTSSPDRWFPITLIAPREQGEYVARDAVTHEELWRSRWLVERVSGGSDSVFRVREDGAGRRGRPEPTRWTASMEIAVADGNEVFSAIKEVRDSSGRLLETQRRTLSYQARSGMVTTIDQDKGTERSVSFAVDEVSIPIELLPMQLRSLPERPGRHMRFHLITRDGKTIPMMARIVGRETVSTPAGEFASYRTELVVTGLRGMVAQFLLPALTMWHRVDPPHAWVRYQGLDGGVGSREVIMELVRFESDAEPGRG